jgi:hypothetical protein
MDENEETINLAGMVLDAQRQAAGSLAGPNLQSVVLKVGEWFAIAWFDAEGAPVDIVGLALFPATLDAPEGGITSKLLEEVNLTALREDFVARQVLMTLVGRTVKDEAAGLSTEEAVRRAAESMPTRAELSTMTRKLRPRRGRKPLQKDEELRDVALRYLDAQQHDSRRVLVRMGIDYSKDGIKDMNYPKIRNLVSDARAAGWLTTEGQGKRGSTDAGPKLKEWRDSQEGDGS